MLDILWSLSLLQLLDISDQEVSVSGQPGLETIKVLDLVVGHPLLPGKVKFYEPLIVALEHILIHGQVLVVALSSDKLPKLSEIPDVLILLAQHNTLVADLSGPR